ncbi:MAG: DUF655 domain-containing protein [Desulfurococcales archaeon]|nr:DUF655 domain-containing protein [Desulfurococcales archaeon]
MQGPRGARRPSTEGAERQQHPAALEGEAIVLDYMPGGYYADPHPEHRETPVAQAVGVKRFTLIDGIPLTRVDVFDKVTLAREISRTIIQPLDQFGRRIRRLTIQLACLPGADKRIYCCPVSRLSDQLFEILNEEVSRDQSRVVLVNDPNYMVDIAVEKGLPDKILVVPRKPLTYNDLSDIAKSNLPEAVKRIILENEEFFVSFFNVAEPINIRLHALELLAGIGKRTVKQIISERARRPFTRFEEVKRIIKVDPLEALADRIVNEIRGVTGDDKSRQYYKHYYLFIPPPNPEIRFLDYLSKMKRPVRK